MSTTIDDIAKKCGLSRATVSRVLRNSPNVSEKSRCRVEKVIADVGYQPNQIAQSLAQGYSNMVALIVGNISSVAQIEIAKTIQKGLYNNGLMAWLCNSDYSATLCDAYLDTAVASKLAGAFLITTTPSPRKLAQITKSGMPVVLVNRVDLDASCDSILGDEQKSAYQATNHLIGLGHRNIILLSVPQSLVAGRNAYWGYRTALEANGIPFREDRIYAIDINTYSDVLNVRHPFEAVRLFTEHPEATAVICLSNEVAVDFYGQCRQLGKPIPEEMSMVCLDPVRANWLQGITFSTFGASQEVMGEAAVKQMLARIQARKDARQGTQLPPTSNIVLEPSYVEGTSVREPNR